MILSPAEIRGICGSRSVRPDDSVVFRNRSGSESGETHASLMRLPKIKVGGLRFVYHELTSIRRESRTNVVCGSRVEYTLAAVPVDPDQLMAAIVGGASLLPSGGPVWAGRQRSSFMNATMSA